MRYIKKSITIILQKNFLFYLMAILLWIFLYTNKIEASYRVYQLEIGHYDDKGKIIKKETRLSTLPPEDFRSYSTYSDPVDIKLMDTWVCPGDTGHYRNFCANPNPKPLPPPIKPEKK